MGSFPIGYPRADPGRVAKPHVIHSIIEWVAQDEINHETIFKVFNIRPNGRKSGSSGLVASASRRNLLWYFTKIYFGISSTLPRYNLQHKQSQATLALLIRVVAKINVRIEQNPGYGMLNTYMPLYANW